MTENELRKELERQMNEDREPMDEIELRKMRKEETTLGGGKVWITKR